MVKVESVLAGTVMRSGLDHDDLAVTLEEAFMGRRASMRRIEMLIGSPLARCFGDGRDGDTDVEMRELPRNYGIGGGYLTAEIPLAGGFAWNRGRIMAHPSALPETMVQALVGQPSRLLLVHPDVDPEAVIEREDGSGPLCRLRIPTRIVEVGRGVGTLRRLRLRLARQNRERLDRMRHVPANFGRRIAGSAAANAVILIAIAAMAISSNPYRYPVLAVGALASFASLLILWTLATARTVSDWTLDEEHKETLAEMRTARLGEV